MNKLYGPCALMALVQFASAASAEEKPATQWLVDRTLTISRQPAPVPALEYRLLPPSWELKDGNAVPIYLRLVHQQSDAARDYWTKGPKPWNEMPIDKMPLDKARKFLNDHQHMLRQFELGARRKTAEWNYTLDEGNPIGILLPDAAGMRGYAPMLVLQIRVAIADGDFVKAVHHLQTGFAFSRHVSDGPFFINTLVGLALANIFVRATADFVERPGAPNLYWALAALPHPMVDLRRGRDLEYRLLEWWFPELEDLDRERPAAQWDALLHKVRSELQRAIASGPEQKLPDSYPKGCAPDDPATKSPDLAAARNYVARTRKISAEQAEAMPAAQAVLIYLVGTYAVHRDEVYKTFFVPFTESRQFLEAAEKRMRTGSQSEGHAVAAELLPAVAKIRAAQYRLERNLAAVQIIEALRLYAAGHNGNLPDKLADVTEVPIPKDPGTGQPFAYTPDGQTATLTSQIPGDSLAVSGIRYRLTVRKK